MGACGLKAQLLHWALAERYHGRHVDAARRGARQDRPVAPPAASDWSRIATFDVARLQHVRDGARKPDNVPLFVLQNDSIVFGFKP